MSTRLRITNEGDIVGPKTRIGIVTDAGELTETVEDLTERLRVTSIAIDLTVGQASKATLECICFGGTIDAVLDDLVVIHLGPSRFGRWTWRLKKWWWGVVRGEA